jgi:PRTRC genetic system protein A
MSTVATMDARDAVMCRATPTVMVPRFGTIEQLPVGRKRFLAAEDGLYLEVHSPAMHACLRVSDVCLPYGPQVPFLALAGGALPDAILHHAVQLAQVAAPNEMACAITLDAAGAGYQIAALPTDHASLISVSYQDIVDDDTLVVDIHSHGELESYFSAVDDESDRSRRGPYLSFVIGRCNAGAQPTLRARFCCSPFLIDLSYPALKALEVLL